jgi:hypothetical protein
VVQDLRGEELFGQLGGEHPAGADRLGELNQVGGGDMGGCVG